MLWNSTVRGDARSGDAPVMARFPILSVAWSAAHSSRMRACVVEPRVRRDVEIQGRGPPEGPCILTASAGAWSAMCRFRCVSSRSHATRSAGQCKGGREPAVGGQRTNMGSLGYRHRLKCHVSRARTRACGRGQHELPCGYPAAETNRRTVHFVGEREWPIGRWAAVSMDCRSSALSAVRIRHRSADSRRCGYLASRTTRSAVVFNGEGARAAGRRYRIVRG
jgi:hypothetical protein